MAETVIYGPDQESGALVGLTLAEVRQMYENQFNIPKDAAAFVNGKQVKDEAKYIIQEGDKVKFDKPQVRSRA